VYQPTDPTRFQALADEASDITSLRQAAELMADISHGGIRRRLKLRAYELGIPVTDAERAIYKGLVASAEKVR
jgi:hypothetical protein